MKPSFESLIEKTNVSSSQIESMFGFQKKKCPKGTVPIQRQMISLKRKLSVNNHILVQDVPGIHVRYLI